MSICKQRVFSITEKGTLYDEEFFPASRSEPHMESIDYELAGYPEPVLNAGEVIYFSMRVRSEERTVLFDGGWTITGMGHPRSDCGNHLGLYSDGRNFTRSRSSCHRQVCPICSWKWEAKAGDNASQFLQFVQKQMGCEMRHASFNPALEVRESKKEKSKKTGLPRLEAVLDDEGHVVPAAPAGDMEAFKLSTMREMLDKFHDASNGPLGYAYILHPGRETIRGSGAYYYSPHVHLITNFVMRQSAAREFRKECLEKGFTFTVFRNQRTASYAIDCRDYDEVIRDKEGNPILDKNGMEQPTGRKLNDLTAKLVYNFSHALVKKNVVQNHAGVTYCAAFRPQNYEYIKVKRKVLVRSKQGRAFFKIREQPPVATTLEIPHENGTITRMPVSEHRPLRKKGKIVPEYDFFGSYKFLKIWRFRYIDSIEKLRRSDRVVAASGSLRDAFEIAEKERKRWKKFDTKKVCSQDRSRG